jgi:hypothetical protein
MGDFEDDREEPPFRDPLPLDDRLWRHPSELQATTIPSRRSPVRRLLDVLRARGR